MHAYTRLYETVHGRKLCFYMGCSCTLLRNHASSCIFGCKSPGRFWCNSIYTRVAIRILQVRLDM